jgi:hypothetical protein
MQQRGISTLGKNDPTRLSTVPTYLVGNGVWVPAGRQRRAERREWRGARVWGRAQNKNKDIWPENEPTACYWRLSPKRMPHTVQLPRCITDTRQLQQSVSRLCYENRTRTRNKSLDSAGFDAKDRAHKPIRPRGGIYAKTQSAIPGPLLPDSRLALCACWFRTNRSYPARKQPTESA